MSQTEQLLGPDGPGPRFAVAFRGYDRVQVDSWLEAHGRWAADAQSRLGEMAHRAQVLESQSPEPDATSPPLTETLAIHVLEGAHDLARQLPEHVIRDAEAERQRLEQSAAEVVETARARSAQIVEAARSDRDEAIATLHEACEQIDVARLQTSDEAKERVRRRWEDATTALTDAEVELARLRARRQLVLSELTQLEQSIVESRRHLREHGATDVEAHNGAKRLRAEPRPEQDRWALMPIEW